ncbi:hypothetical protein AZG88_42875 [Rhodococcus sp. LB1]|nr:hypothetical protein AZG88_42875 [Rhodococcus sp. LB1]
MVPGCTHRGTPLIAAICGAPFQTRRQPARRRRLGSREFDVTVVDEDSGAIVGRDRPHPGVTHPTFDFKYLKFLTSMV